MDVDVPHAANAEPARPRDGSPTTKPVDCSAKLRESGSGASQAAPASSVSSFFHRDQVRWQSQAAPASSVSSFFHRDQVRWQWEHRSGFVNYDSSATERIERAYQRGDPHVRLRSGKFGTVPMEVHFYDMIQHDPITGNTRAVQRLGPDGFWDRARRKVAGVVRAVQSGRPRQIRFAEYRQAMERPPTISAPTALASDVYHTTGFCAQTVRSCWFVPLTTVAIVLNVVWIGLDTEFNHAPTLAQTPAVFVVMDNLFCILFTLEIALRFGAYREKAQCLQDNWFCFEAFLVVLMVGETWALPLALVVRRSKGAGSGSVPPQLSVLRLARLCRLSRLTRLLRLMPEFSMLVKSIVQAMRSVGYTMVLLLVLLLVFGVIFKTQAEGSPELEALFPSVGRTMMVLLWSGALLDGPARVADAAWTNRPFLAFMFIFFIFLSSFTVMNMLLGILCEVSDSVKERERERAEVAQFRGQLLEVLECHDMDNDRCITAEEFEVLIRNPEIHTILQNFDVDVEDLISLKSFLFLDKNATVSLDSTGEIVPRQTRQLGFSQLLQVAVRLRGGNTAIVTDVVELREYMGWLFSQLERLFESDAGGGAAERRPRPPEPPEPPGSECQAGVPAATGGATPQEDTAGAPASWEEAALAQLTQLQRDQQELRSSQEELAAEQQKTLQDLSALKEELCRMQVRS